MYLSSIFCFQSWYIIGDWERITDANWIQETNFTGCPYHKKFLSLETMTMLFKLKQNWECRKYKTAPVADKREQYELLQ